MHTGKYFSSEYGKCINSSEIVISVYQLKKYLQYFLDDKWYINYGRKITYKNQIDEEFIYLLCHFTLYGLHQIRIWKIFKF